MRWSFLLAGALAVITISTGSQAQVSAIGCGDLANAYGPYDYRADRDRSGDGVPHSKKLWLVEHVHFTSRVERLISGESGSLGAELDYTLRAFPNHHRALISVMRWGEKTNSPQPATLPRQVECYFERALRFRPDDTTARLLYATFLINRKRRPEALEQIEITRVHAGDNAFTHYNIGLVFLDAGEPDQALVQAHRAISLGLERTELREKLIALGRWQDAAASTPPAMAASAPTQ